MHDIEESKRMVWNRTPDERMVGTCEGIEWIKEIMGRRDELELLLFEIFEILFYFSSFVYICTCNFHDGTRTRREGILGKIQLFH